VYARHQASGPLVTHLLTSLEQLLSLRPGLRWRDRHGPRAHIALALERRQAERSTELLAPGSAILAWARQLWSIGDVPTRVLPLSIDVAAVRADANGPLPDGFPVVGPTVTFASRMDGHKGAQHLMEAMHRVWRRHDDAQLVYVGRDAPWKQGMMSEYLRELAGDRSSQVHILGGQPPDRYFSAVAASDIVAIPSLWESFCLAAVEAMALGRPVVGTRDNGFSEFIVEDQNGLLVDRGAVEELGAAIERLLEDGELRRRLGESARSTAASLDASKLAPRYVDVFSELA
jgi:glycosyltransferase involved in cell wall biosynthesis